MKLPRASIAAWARLPGWQRASIAWELVVAIEVREKLGDVSADKARKRAAGKRRDKALLGLLLSVDPHLERHLARYERSIRG